MEEERIERKEEKGTKGWEKGDEEGKEEEERSEMRDGWGKRRRNREVKEDAGKGGAGKRLRGPLSDREDCVQSPAARHARAC